MFTNNRNNTRSSNIETSYIVEWTKNKTIINQMNSGSASLDFSKLNKNKFNNLNQAVQFFVVLQKENTPYCRLFLEITIDGVTVIEDCITDIEYSGKEHELLNKIDETHDQTLFEMQSFLHRNKWDIVWDTFKKETHAEYNRPEYYKL
jgi:hypothetical protein